MLSFTSHSASRLSTNASSWVARRSVPQHVVSDFLKRIDCLLILKQGKVLLSARVDIHIVQETEQFIEQWGKVVEKKRIMKFNVVVFDETVAGYSTKLSKVVEFRDKGAARVCRVCEKRLCVQIPFSSNDGRTHFQRKKRMWCKKRLHGGWASRELLPAKSIQRRYFITQAGFLNADVFSVIPNELLDAWSIEHPGVEYFLLSDSLAIHTNSVIVSAAAR